jgi:hypothetical protein
MRTLFRFGNQPKELCHLHSLSILPRKTGEVVNGFELGGSSVGQIQYTTPTKSTNTRAKSTTNPNC